MVHGPVSMSSLMKIRTRMNSWNKFHTKMQFLVNENIPQCSATEGYECQGGLSWRWGLQWPPSLPRDQWDMGKWCWAEKHSSSTTAKYIRIFVCVYTLYRYLYNVSVYIQTRSNPGFLFFIQYQSVQTSVTHRRTHRPSIALYSPHLIFWYLT